MNENPDRLGNLAAHALLRADIEAALTILEQVALRIGMKSEKKGFWELVVELREQSLKAQLEKMEDADPAIAAEILRSIDSLRIQRGKPDLHS